MKEPRKILRWPRFVAALKETRQIFVDAQLPLNASSLAYTTVLSIIPLLAVSFSIFKAFGGLETLYKTIEPYILSNLAEGTGDEAILHIQSFISNIHAGALGATGLVGLIITCMSLLLSVEKAIHRIWGEKVTRGFFHRISSYWLIITLGPLTAAMLVGYATTTQLPMSALLPSGWGSAIMGYVTSTAIFVLIFKGVPSRKVDWTPALLSAMLSAVAWSVARWSYALYNQKVLTYSKIYGSLGAIPILLLWIYIVWLIVLSGAALTYGLQKRRDPPVKVEK